MTHNLVQEYHIDTATSNAIMRIIHDASKFLKVIATFVMLYSKSSWIGCNEKYPGQTLKDLKDTGVSVIEVFGWHESEQPEFPPRIDHPSPSKIDMVLSGL